MKFDEVIDYIGGFGLYQKRTYLLVCLVAIPPALQIMITVFILDTPPHRCAMTGVDNDTFQIRHSSLPQVVDAHVPLNRAGDAFDKCKLYSSDRPTNKTEGCTRWVYSKEIYEQTVITKFDIVCDKKFYKNHHNMIVMAGILVGSVGLGSLSDIIGRRKTLLISLLTCLVASVAAAFMPNFWAFVAARFFTTVGTSGMFLCAFVSGMELVSPKQRTLAGIVIEMFWCVGLFILAAAAYAVRDWQHLQLVVSVPCVLFVSYYWLMPESARWLISRGRIDEASKIVRHAAKVNKSDASEKVLSLVALEKEDKGEKVWHMFTKPVLLVRTLIIYLNWAVVSMVYYGLGLNVNALSGNIFVNFTIASAVELAAYVFCLVLLDRVGRKVLHSSTMILAGLACLGTIFPTLYGDASLNWITVTLSMVGKFGASAAFAIIYIYSAELFPTVMRNSGLGTSSFCARIGSMLSPYIADLGEIVDGDIGVALPVIVFGGFSLLAGLLALFLPETHNRNLPETIHDALVFGKQEPHEKYKLESHDKNGDVTASKANDISSSTQF